LEKELEMKAWRIACALAFALALASPAHPAGDTAPVPETPRSPYDEGRNQANMGNWERAADLFQRAAAANPKDHQSLNMLGYALRKIGKAKEAVEAYSRALAVKPDYAQALEYRGMAHLMMGNRKAALADYQALAKLGSPLAQDLKEEIDKMPAN